MHRRIYYGRISSVRLLFNHKNLPKIRKAISIQKSTTNEKENIVFLKKYFQFFIFVANIFRKYLLNFSTLGKKVFVKHFFKLSVKFPKIKF